MGLSPMAESGIGARDIVLVLDLCWCFVGSSLLFVPGFTRYIQSVTML